MTLTDFLLARIAETERWGQCFPKDSPGGRYILAECEAKRRIVEECKAWSDEWAAENLGGHVLRHLATIYADHPDYRDEWKP